MKYLDTFLRIVDFKKTSTCIPSPLSLPPPKKNLCSLIKPTDPSPPPQRRAHDRILYPSCKYGFSPFHFYT